MVRLYGVPLSIISDWGTQSTSQFWKSFQKGLGSKLIREKLKMTQSRQKSYPNVRRKDLEFEVNEWAYLKISPMKGVMKFGKKGKPSHIYVGPYLVLRRVGKVAYELDLPNELTTMHPIFYLSKLKKCVGDLTSIVSLEGLGVDESLSDEEVPVEILDRQVKRLRNKEIASMKVLWRNQLRVLLGRPRPI
ncbi:hypothetical protein MTR67_001508 [Solanum verrucosum]|uniref:Tf2-1-like SH3-like domain-containing protein n=1 Tax=Solanum verrucosum TaxID=315347 RepID=A0AAF0T8H6_SOLVR|nr:hypothetical protein MTR67_001508 [Solanum verrucosum]